MDKEQRLVTRKLYHGTDSDKILEMLSQRLMAPNSEGKIYFSEFGYRPALMHGPETFAVKVHAVIPRTPA
jgi:hypothetical protein